MIGNILKQILEEKNISVSELSKKTNINIQTLYSIIKRNNTKVDIAILLKICDVLRVDIERFYGDYVKEKVNKNIVLNMEENEIITTYRNLTEDSKNKVRDYLSLVYNAENK